MVTNDTSRLLILLIGFTLLTYGISYRHQDENLFLYQMWFSNIKPISCKPLWQTVCHLQHRRNLSIQLWDYRYLWSPLLIQWSNIRSIYPNPLPVSRSIEGKSVHFYFPFQVSHQALGLGPGVFSDLYDRRPES